MRGCNGKNHVLFPLSEWSPTTNILVQLGNLSNIGENWIWNWWRKKIASTSALQGKMLARIVWPKYLLSTYRAFSIHSTSLSSHVFSSISFNKSEHQLFNWALRAFGKRTRTIVKATQYIHSKYVNVCFLLCWPLKCVGVCFVLPLCISLYFLAPNPLIILTDPSPAKIQNQHAHSEIQREYSALLQPPPWPGLSPGWSQSLQSLAVPGSPWQ